MEKFKKQPYEEFFISSSILNVQDADEVIVLSSSTVTAVDALGADASATVLDGTSIKLADEGAYTDNVLSIRVQAGIEADSPYQITFRMVTDKGNKFEVDIKMSIREI